MHGRNEMNRLRIRSLELLLVVGLSLGACSWYSISRGQDRNFDQLSYHTYAGWALNGRVAQDILVSGSTTYLNQWLYAPYFFLISVFAPRSAGTILGALHGLNIVLLYFLARQLLQIEQRRLRVGLAALVAITGAASPMFLSEVGTSFADNIGSLLVLVGLLLLFRAMGCGCRIYRRPDFIAAGLLFGLVTGLKLTNAVFSLGVLAAVFVVRTTWRDRAVRLAVMAGAIVVGFAIAGGPLAWELWREYQNPLYPFQNQIFKSPYFPPVAAADTRWIPHSLTQGLSYPFQWMAGMAPTNEIPFRDLRFGFIFLLLALAGLRLGVKWLGRDGLLPKPVEYEKSGRLASVEKAGVLLVFFFVSYAAWLVIFSIQRYIVPLELLTGLVMIILVDYVAQGREMKLFGAVLLCLGAVATVSVPDWGHVRWSSNWYGFRVPKELKVEGGLYLTVSDLVGHVCPSLPRSSRYIMIRQPHSLDQAKSLYDRIDKIIKSNLGPLRMLGKAQDFPANRLAWATWVNYYGLRPSSGTCTKIDGTYEGHVACLLEPMLLSADRASVLRWGMAEGTGLRGYQSGAVQFGETFTVEAVLTPSALQRPIATVMSNQPSSGAFQGLSVERLGAAANDYVVRLGGGSGWMPAGHVVLSAGRRAYLCLVVNDRRTQLYLDGRPVQSATLPHEIVESGAPLIIGNWAANDRSFSGLIEEVQVMRRALRESEIREISGHVSKHAPPKVADLGVLEFEIGRMMKDLPDEVGRFEIQPDGQADNVIPLGMTGGFGTISSIQVDLYGEDGRGQGCWDTKSSTSFWMVGVYRHNRPVVSSKAADLQLGVKQGDEIQLRVTGNGSVQTGKRFLVTLVMQDGHVVTQTAVMP